MRKISDTYLFTSSGLKNFTENVKMINWSTERVSPISLEDNLKIISRRFNFPLKTVVIESYEKSKLVTIYPYNTQLTKLIPIFLTKQEGEIRAIINLSLYGNKNKNEEIIIDNRRLYALLEGAYIYKSIYEKPNYVLSNMMILNLSTQIYVKMMNKVLDKMFGINLIVLKSDQINYLLAKFFLSYVMEKADGDVVNSIAYACCFNDSPKINVESIMQDFDETVFSSLPEFFRELSEKFDLLHNLTIRKFLDNYMIMYGEYSVFSIECYYSFLQTIFAGGVIGARFGKDYMIEKVVGRESLKLHNEISRLLR